MIRKICPEDTIFGIGVLVWIRKNGSDDIVVGEMHFMNKCE